MEYYNKSGKGVQLGQVPEAQIFQHIPTYDYNIHTCFNDCKVYDIKEIAGTKRKDMTLFVYCSK